MADKPGGGKPAGKSGGGGKPAAKPSGGGGSAEGQMIFIAVIAVVILFVVFPTVLMFFGYNGHLNFLPNNLSESLNRTFSSFVDTVGFISIFISLLFVMGLIYTKVRYKEIVVEYTALQTAKDNIGKSPHVGAGTFKSAMESPVVANANGATVGGLPLQAINPKWIEVEKHMQSSSASEWKVAILEADIMLYDMLTQMGYEGDSIGEILKKVDKANFVTIDDAWKAHRIRNIIAHEGSNYELSREEADRTIRLFKRVFDEFYFV